MRRFGPVDAKPQVNISVIESMGESTHWIIDFRYQLDSELEFEEMRELVPTRTRVLCVQWFNLRVEKLDHLPISRLSLLVVSRV